MEGGLFRFDYYFLVEDKICLLFEMFKDLLFVVVFFEVSVVYVKGMNSSLILLWIVFDGSW